MEFIVNSPLMLKLALVVAFIIGLGLFIGAYKTKGASLEDMRLSFVFTAVSALLLLLSLVLC